MDIVMEMHGDAIIALVMMVLILFVSLISGIIRGNNKDKELFEEMEKEDKIRFSVLITRTIIGIYFSGILSGLSTALLMPIVLRSFVPDLDITIIIVMCSLLGIGTAGMVYFYLKMLNWRIEVEEDFLNIVSFRKEGKVIYFSDLSHVKEQEHNVNSMPNIGVAIYIHSSKKAVAIVGSSSIGYKQLIKRLKEKGVVFKESL